MMAPGTVGRVRPASMGRRVVVHPDARRCRERCPWLEFSFQGQRDLVKGRRPLCLVRRASVMVRRRAYCGGARPYVKGILVAPPRAWGRQVGVHSGVLRTILSPGQASVDPWVTRDHSCPSLGPCARTLELSIPPSPCLIGARWLSTRLTVVMWCVGEQPAMLP